jgi:torulene dioxygenase
VKAVEANTERGILYRTGPGGYQLATSKDTTFSISHWFDGFAQTHRFELLPPTEGANVTKVMYNSRHTSDEMIEKVRKTGKFMFTSFAQKRDPCESFFKKVMSSYQAMSGNSKKGITGFNIGVTVKPNMPMPSESNTSNEVKHGASSEIRHLWQATDYATLQEINPTTLEPIDISHHPDLHPDLKGPLTGAHSRTDPVTGDWYNYNMDVGRQTTYRVFCVSAKTGETEILAKLSGPDIKAAYLHSIMLTENYVILCLFDAYFAMNGAKMLWTRNELDAMYFDPNKKNVWLVVDRRHGQGLVGMYESDPFFCFHPVNAWEQPSQTEPNKVDIVADLPTYENLDILNRFYYDNMKATSQGARNFTGEKGESSRPVLARYKLSGLGNTKVATTSKPKKAECLFVSSKDDAPELPTFNPNYATKPSRYIYGVCDRGNSSFLDGLVKYDSQTNTSIAWLHHAQSPGEPIFLPDPEGTEEDDGVCLSVVLDGIKGKSYLLVLDARSFEEVGRADMDVVVPFGFHGTHVAKL